MSLYSSNLSHEDISASLNRLSISNNLPPNLNFSLLNNSSSNSSSNNESPSSNSPHSILKIRNVPKDVTLREAFLIFSLCLDDVSFVDIIPDPAGHGPIILSKFHSSKIARQVFLLLNEKNLFGSAFPKVHCELTNESGSGGGDHSNYLFANPFANSTTQNSSPSSTTPKAENIDFPDSLTATTINGQPKLSPPAHSNSNATTTTSTNTNTNNNNNNNNNNNHNNNNNNDSLHSIINSSVGNVTGWSNDTSTPLATPSNTSKIIRPDNLILNNLSNLNSTLNPTLHQLNGPEISSNIPSTPGNQLHTPSLSEWKGNGYFMNDLTTPITGTFPNASSTHPTQQSQNHQQQQQQQQQQQPPQQQPSSATEDPTNTSNIPSHSPTQQQKFGVDNNSIIPDMSLLARVPPPANPADQNPPCNTLYVGNLPPDTSENELRALFRPQPGFKRLSFRTKQTNGVSSHHGPMCFVEFEDVAYATKALAELYGRTLPRQNGTNNNKGGIRLSFSKNPLGVRGPGQQRRNLPNSSSNITSNSTSSSNGNGNANANTNNNAQNVNSNPSPPSLVSRQTSVIVQGTNSGNGANSATDPVISPTFQRTNSLPLQSPMGLTNMNNLNNLNNMNINGMNNGMNMSNMNGMNMNMSNLNNLNSMMNSMNVMQGMNGINLGMNMNNMPGMSGMNVNSLNFPNNLNLGMNGYEFMNDGTAQAQSQGQVQAQAQSQTSAQQQQQQAPHQTQQLQASPHSAQPPQQQQQQH